MDIDERLERLTQRHEALTQTVELLTKGTEGAYPVHRLWE